LLIHSIRRAKSYTQGLQYQRQGLL